MYYDVLIIGCGAAGLSLALRLPQNLKVALIAKGDLKQSSTYRAQGGIAAAIAEQDSAQQHYQDTLDIGIDLCNADVVNVVTEQAPAMIAWLQSIGMPFTLQHTDSQSQQLHLSQESGHRLRRVAHSDDSTGKTLQNTLLAKVVQRSNIHLLQNRMAIDLFCRNKVCHGAYILNCSDNTIDAITARSTVLATGGNGKVYLYTSNSDFATGDGLAMAWRAGCRVANMEFVQFHPSCLYHPQAKSLLLSETLRGEGAQLLLPNGKPFMHRFDPCAELAPRDIVARAIDHEMKRYGIDYVLLDISHRSKSFLRKRFPMIYQRCLEFGYDLAQTPVPVVPAMHYSCGGVISTLSGETDIAGLYAIGEVAHTGLHGANRMASNSLLECLVCAKLAAQKIAATSKSQSQQQTIPSWDDRKRTQAPEDIVISLNWQELRQTMSHYVGIVRTQKRLRFAYNRIELFSAEIDEYYRNFYVSKELLELKNIALVAKLITLSAMSRHESRGLHTLEDYPSLDCNLDHKITCLQPPSFNVQQLPHVC